jgi:hypothetical protein
MQTSIRTSVIVELVVAGLVILLPLLYMALPFKSKLSHRIAVILLVVSAVLLVGIPV